MGLQLFVRVNCKLGLLGQEPVDVPPATPQFPDVAPQNLVITNNGGVVAVKLTCPTDPGTNTVLRASPPHDSAVRACRSFRIVGVCPAPAQGAADITALCTDEFGAVPVGKRLFVRASTMVGGFESLARQFQARVPAAARSEFTGAPSPRPSPPQRGRGCPLGRERSGGCSGVYGGAVPRPPPVPSRILPGSVHLP